VAHIVVVVGMPASGKNFARHYAEENHIPHLTTGDIVRIECASRGLDLTAKNMAKVSDELRGHDPCELTRWLLERVDKEHSLQPMVVLEGMRSWEEVELIRSKFSTTLVAFVTGREIRRERYVARARGDDDPRLFEERENRELEYGTAVPIAMADFYVLNDGTIEETIERFRHVMLMIGATV